MSSGAAARAGGGGKPRGSGHMGTCIFIATCTSNVTYHVSGKKNTTFMVVGGEGEGGGEQLGCELLMEWREGIMPGME